MKKVYLFMMCCFLFSAAPSIQAAPARRNKPVAPAITRDVSDPLLLTLLNTRYELVKSNETKDKDMWLNLYKPQGTEEDDETTVYILITKTKNTTTKDLMESEDPDKFITFDSRNPNDMIFSQMDDDERYLAARAVQVQEDVFMLIVSVPEDSTEKPQTFFRAVRNTPLSVITENFVETACKFGSDCRAD